MRTWVTSRRERRFLGDWYMPRRAEFPRLHAAGPLSGGDDKRPSGQLAALRSAFAPLNIDAWSWCRSRSL